MRTKESEGGIEKNDRQRRGMDRIVAWKEKDREAGLIDKKFDNT